MKKTLLVAMILGATASANTVMAADVTPEQSRSMLIDFHKAKHPNIAFEDYKNGGYIYSDDKKAQWEAVEEFPPYLDAIDAGEKLYKADQAVFAKCFGDDVTKVRASYPYFDEASQKVVTLEGAINKCRADAGLTEYKDASKGKGDIANISGYLAYQARGQIVNVKIDSEGARKAFEDGQSSYIKPIGQFNLSCAKCHTYNAGKRARSDILSPAIGHTTHFPVWRASGSGLITLQSRYVGCHKNMRATPAKVNSETYNNLEFFEAYMSNGLEINGPGYRQ